MATLQERIRRAEQAAEREKEQASQQKMQTAISFGTTLLGAFLGRKAVSAATMGRAATAARAGSRAWKESQDVARATETVEAMRQQLADLESQLAGEMQALEASMSAATEVFETVPVKLKKANIAVRLVVLCWVPYWQDSQGNLAPAL
jgi:cytosine/adenosine deaminase-related metal-dependent hydrolase